MKKVLITLAVISIFSIGALAEDTCQTGYWDLYKRVQNSNELSNEDKAEYLPQLDKAYRL